VDIGLDVGEQRRPRASGRGARSGARHAASRHSRMVRSLKVVLPALAIVVAAALGVQAALYSYAPNLNLPAVLFSKDGLTMVEPRLSGRSNDRAYEVTAARAVQSLDDTKKVRLERVDGRVEMANGQWAKIESKRGLYNGGKETLRLEDGLTIVTSQGYRAATDAADLDLQSGRMTSAVPIRIEGPSGSINAGGVDITENGQTILFTGGVRMTILSMGGAEKPTEAQ
jgi:lipopolysaccharide export system protein LptC